MGGTKITVDNLLQMLYT